MEEHCNRASWRCKAEAVGVDVPRGRLVNLQRQEIPPRTDQGREERPSPSTRTQEAWAEKGAFDDRWENGRREPGSKQVARSPLGSWRARKEPSRRGK